MATVLAACSKGNAPVFDADLRYHAVYKTGDFSYSCTIVKENGVISITPTSTNAAGMTISCDGKTVTFQKEDLIKSYDMNTIDSTNPAVLLYEVFRYLDDTETLNVGSVGELREVSGKTSVGNFTLTLNSDDTLNTLSVPAAMISVIFEEKAS